MSITRNLKVIKTLGILTVEDIKAKQDCFTDASRITALKLFNETIKKENITHEEIINEAINQKNFVYHHGRFGIRGKSGSNFLKEINNFIRQAEYLKQLETEKPESVSESGIRELCMLAINDIEKKQNNNTASSRREALKKLKEVLHGPIKYTDEALLLEVRNQKLYVLDQNQFGIRGKSGSSFLKIINNYLQQSERILLKSQQQKKLPLEKSAENIIPLPPSVPSVSQSVVTLFSTNGKISKVELLNQKYKLLMKKRQRLENEMEDLITKHYPNSRMSCIWNQRMMNKTSPHEGTFFQYFEKEINAIPALKEKVHEYDVYFIKDENFKQWNLDNMNEEARQRDKRDKLENEKRDLDSDRSSWLLRNV